MVTDASIKHNIATSITYIHISNKDVIKTIHYVVNVSFMEAELVAIKCDINQSINIPGILKIIVITDSLHNVRKIFDSLIHLYQKHTAAILYELRRFFPNNINNSIEFWECPSQCKWSLHKAVDMETKCYDMVKGEAVIFFIYSLGFYFEFTFLLLCWWWQWRGMWHCSHMTCYMIWCHKSLEQTRVG